MKSILVISPTDLKQDPRVNRQLRLLAQHYEVTALGCGAPDIPGVQYIHVSDRSSKRPAERLRMASSLLLRQYDQAYWRRSFPTMSLAAIGDRKFDVILANDILSLPLALKIAAGKARVVFDAHEYAPKEFEDSLAWRLLSQGLIQSLCDRYLSQADAMMTVGQSIAEEYRMNFGVSSSVVFNAPSLHENLPAPTQENVIRMIHHGGAMRTRKIETMIAMMKHLDQRFHLDLMLVCDDAEYLAGLKALAASDPRIRFIPPVPMRDIVGFINQYDIGVYILAPSSFNNFNALPNKFFEFVQARLMIAIGPSPEMKRLTEKYRCGVVAENFTPQALAAEIGRLDAAQVMEYKRNSHLAAMELCAEKNAQVILDLVEGGS